MNEERPWWAQQRDVPWWRGRQADPNLRAAGIAGMALGAVLIVVGLVELIG